MKSFLSFLATFSLIEAIGRHPATAGALMLLGVGGGAVGGALLTTPTIVPQPTAFFSNGNAAATNNGLKTPANAFETPAVPTHSMGLLVEGSVSPGLGFSGAPGTQYALGLGTVANNFQGLQISDNISGLPAFYFQKVWASTGTTSWWQAQGSISSAPARPMAEQLALTTLDIIPLLRREGCVPALERASLLGFSVGRTTRRRLAE